MKKSDAISLHAKAENWPRFPVMVWEEGKELVTQVDGKVYKAANILKLDAALDAGGVTIPTMRRYAAAGRLPYTRLPSGHYRFLRLDVLALRMIPPQSPTQPGRPAKFGKLEVTP